MAKLTDVLVDESAAREGVWIEWVHGIRLRIAAATGPKYDTAYHRQVVPALLKLPAKKRRSGAAVMDLSLEVVARHCLIGWENLEDDDGQAIPYSPEKAVELCKLSSALYRTVYAQAVNDENYMAATLAEYGDLDDEEEEAPEGN